ncbi:unnamed protein product [Trichobilharzia regenti]|nr:unnamed protein product [Trichobilharzia regenti]
MKYPTKYKNMLNFNNSLNNVEDNRACKTSVICGTCGRKDTTPYHPILYEPVISCEYSYGCHNPSNTPKWLDMESIERLIIQYGLAQNLAEQKATTN